MDYYGLENIISGKKTVDLVHYRLKEYHDVCLPNSVDDHKKFSFRTETLD